MSSVSRVVRDGDEKTTAGVCYICNRLSDVIEGDDPDTPPICMPCYEMCISREPIG